EVQGPALRPIDTVDNRFPSGTVPVDVPVLQLHPRAGRRLGVKPHLDLTRLRRIGLDSPTRADIPAEHHPVRRIESQDPGPPALTPVRFPVNDVPADPRLEYRFGYRRLQQVVLWRLEVTEPMGEHHEGTIDRRADDNLLADRHCFRIAHQSSLVGASTTSAYPVRARRQ